MLPPQGVENSGLNYKNNQVATPGRTRVYVPVMNAILAGVCTHRGIWEGVQGNHEVY